MVNTAMGSGGVGVADWDGRA